MADHCPFVETCRLYPVFRLQASLRTWQIRYCEADYEGCERHRRAKLGLPVPLQLLPNGKSLPASAKKAP